MQTCDSLMFPIIKALFRNGDLTFLTLFSAMLVCTVGNLHVCNLCQQKHMYAYEKT